MKARIFSDGFEGHRSRSASFVEKLMRREKIKPEIAITFADPLDLANFLTVNCIRLCEATRRGPVSVSQLATELKRDPKSVRRDIGKMERAGLLRTRLVSNPGHGKTRIVESVAQKFELIATF